MRISGVAVALATGSLLLAASPAGARDYSIVARNIIPSGQYGSVPPPAGADAQAQMYDGLTPLFNRVTNADLFRYFKSERLDTTQDRPDTTEPRPRAGVSIVRDKFHVPHIYGKTHDDVTFGAGWVVAEDRGLLIEQARYNSRVAAVDAPGLSALALIAGLKAFVPSAQTERFVALQTTELRRHGSKGRAVLHDIDVYVAGINAYKRSVKATTKPWTRNDIYAVNALKGQFVGQGGGRESSNAMFLDGLRQRLGAARGMSVFNDLRQRNNPETPVTIDGRFPYAPTPKTQTGNVVIDAGSFQSTATPATAARAPERDPQASNALLISARRSTNGHPLMVAGPQIGYFYPGLTLEMDLHGPGINARGATSVPFPGYMLIGRGEDFAWSLTSAGGDIIDQYVETLCGGSDRKYMFRGQCRNMGNFDAGVLKGSGDSPDREITFPTTVHGPVVGYATAKGRRVAISSKRSSRGKDVVDQLFYRDLTVGAVRSVASFFRAANQTPQTFNSLYLDDKHVAMFTSGLLPIRPADVDPGLPTEGTGKHEWRGFISQNAHPHGIDPKDGTLVNWNNQPARGFSASDSQFAYGSEQRVQLLDRGLAARSKHDLASVTSAMNQAATQDIRDVVTLPIISAVLRTGPTPNARDSQMLDLLEQWRRAGGSRLDRNQDGTIDDPGAAIMDTAWPKIADVALAPVLGPQLDEFSKLNSRFDLPPGGQFDGWHMYLDKDLRSLLHRRVSGPFANRYCGAGDLAACRNSLWQAIDTAGNELEAAQGTDPTLWRSDAGRERIKFIPGLLPFTMRYTNRPTGIQQVISFRGHRR